MQVFNTLTRRKETLKPIREGKLGMYVCGMTVYDYCHLGHARVMVAFDVISRWLRVQGYDLTYVRNITDIDDKIIARANDNNEPIDELTGRFIAAMHEDADRLGVLPPDEEPRATDHLADMHHMIAQLIDKGYAYQGSNNDVYYRVSRFDGYGALSGKILEDLRSGERVSVVEAKEDPLDFVLWKTAKPDEPAWPSPWGDGRPGWHIECSAMSTKLLGNHFDIHGGGPDLKFPHHENEIAQSEACTGETYANTWMHAGAVRVDNEKMSKSLGNFFTIREILDRYHPEVVRLFLISSHYRSAINYADSALDESKARLDRFYQALEGITPASTLVEGELSQRFAQSMNDDFNTAGALAVLFDGVKKLNSAEQADQPQIAAELVVLGGKLGILQMDPEQYLQSGSTSEIDAQWVEQQIALRLQARADKDWAESDRIRDALVEQGIILKDGREGTTWHRS